MGERVGALEMLVSARPLPAIAGAGARHLIESDRRVVVTGAGGWLGLATLELLHGILGETFQRRVACFGASNRTLRLRGGVEITQAPLAALADLPPAPSLMLHLAFLTQGPAMTLSSEGYVAANRVLSAAVLGALDTIGAEAVFVASSGAAYLADPSGGPQSKELYGWLKLENERTFGLWGRVKGRTVVTARAFNLSGPYINRRATYALASFVADALAGRPIDIRATNRVYRSYTSIRQLMSVVFGAFTGPPSGEIRFETAGEDVLEMSEVAVAVAETLAPGLPIRRPPIDEAAAVDRYVGDGTAYDALSRQFGVMPILLPEQIRETAIYMDEFPETT